MKKVNFLFFPVLLFSLFFIAGTVNAYDSAVVWNQPTGPTGPITLQPGFSWEFLASGTFPATSREWSITVNSPRLTPGVVLLRLVWDTATSDTGIVVMGGVAYKRAVISQLGPQTFSGSVTWPTCSNGHFVDVLFTIYIDPLSPYNTTKNCPPGSVIQDGVCVTSITLPQPVVSPALNCPSSQGYVYQDGICIKSTVTGVPFCGNNIKEGTEQCDGTNLTGCSAGDFCIAAGQANQCTCAQPPIVTLLEPTADYCAERVIFRWQYNSAQSYSQSAWQMQVSTNNSFNQAGLIYDSGKISGSGTNNYFSVFLASNPSTVDHIHYGTLYYWRVKVWDSTDHSSVGYSSVNTYTFPYAHPGPAVSYTTAPETPTVGQKVTFTDNNSKCYDDGGSSYDCNIGPSNTYQWWFNVDADIKTSLITCSIDNSAICGVASHSYENGIYLTKLQICDPVGAEIGCCYAASNIRVGSGKAVPQWWEISPY